MNKVCFLLGTPEYRALQKGELLTDWTFNQLSYLADKYAIDVEIVFAVTDQYYASKNKTAIGIERIRAERARMLDEISLINPDLVVCFGPVAAAGIFDKGNLTEQQLQRRIHHPIPDGPPVAYTSSIEQIRMAPGMVEWWDLDLGAALAGYNKTTVDWWALNCFPPKHSPPDKGALVGFDIETTGLDCWASNAAITMAVFSWLCNGEMVTYVYDWEKLPDQFREILKSPDYTKVGSNIGFDVKWCARFGVPVVNYLDLHTVEHVLHPGNARLSLKDLAFKYFPQVGNYAETIKQLAKDSNDDWSKIPREALYEYCAADGQVSLQAGLAHQRLLAASDYRTHSAVRLMCDLYPILVQMNIDGACVDPAINEELDGLYQAKMAELRGQITQILGPINLNSTDQLAKALRESVPGIDLSVRKVKKVLDFDDREDEEISTDRRTLEREAEKHPIIGLILEYRRYRTRHSTFIKSLRDKHMVTHHGLTYIHPDFRSDVTDTYRLSSRNPNGQNMPRNEADPVYSVKRQYVSRFKGGTVMDVDMAQIELRVAAWFSGDKALQDVFLSGRDAHSEMLSPMLDKAPGDITPEERQHWKPANFLVVYGGGAYKLAQDLKITMAKASSIINKYFAAYPQMDSKIQEVHQQTKESLRVITPFGFRRIFFEPEHWRSKDGFSILRQAWNTIIQNTAACLMYCAMLRCVELWGERQSVLFVQVHDSLGVDVAPGEEEEVARILHRAMVEAPDVARRYGVDFTLPLACDIKAGQSWGETKKMEVK